VSKVHDIYGGKNPWDLPAYTIPMASRFVRLPVATLRSWVVGRSYATMEGAKHAAPLIHPPEGPHARFLSFTNLVEAHVLASMRRVHEIKMYKVRSAIAYVEREFDVKHALAREVFRTDGVDLFVERVGKLVNVSAEDRGQLRLALHASLKRVDYVGGIASQLYPLVRTAETVDQPKLIVIDPRMAFGRPVLRGTAIPVEEIAQRFQAGDSVEVLVEEFGVSKDLVDEALRAKILEAA
jgi:uncharacterized protein (DUF433 family)